jgi:hypothetical protein
MALTTKEKHDSMFYLGYPAKILIASSTHYQKTLNDRLDNLVADAEARVRSLLASLKRVDEQLEAAACRFSTSQVQDIQINPEERNLLIKERKRFTRELSHTLDVPLIAGDGVNMQVCV